MLRRLIAVLLLGLPVLAAAEPVPDLGRDLAAEQIAPYAITVFPDGRGLPAGSGTVAEGLDLYEGACASCHGEAGVEGPAARLVGDDGFIGLGDPLRILRVRKYPLLVLSVGGMWPYATSIFDYVRRAMPHTAPKSLTDDEVYALTAYILYLNDLVERDAVLDRTSLPSIVMPGAKRGTE